MQQRPCPYRDFGALPRSAPRRRRRRGAHGRRARRGSRRRRRRGLLGRGPAALRRGAPPGLDHRARPARRGRWTGGWGFSPGHGSAARGGRRRWGGWSVISRRDGSEMPGVWVLVGMTSRARGSLSFASCFPLRAGRQAGKEGRWRAGRGGAGAYIYIGCPAGPVPSSIGGRFTPLGRTGTST